MLQGNSDSKMNGRRTSCPTGEAVKKHDNVYDRLYVPKPIEAIARPRQVVIFCPVVSLVLLCTNDMNQAVGIETKEPPSE
jgi:hypothetical protein